jgi:two-component system cell cycle sensor histidine kinase/response regulator CckA
MWSLSRGVRLVGKGARSGTLEIPPTPLAVMKALNPRATIEELVAQSTDPVYITDERGRLFDVNAHACDELGFNRTELLGMRISDVDAGHPLTIRAELRRLALGEDTEQQRRVHRRRDGETFSVEVHSTMVELDEAELICTRAHTVHTVVAKTEPAPTRPIELSLFRELFDCSSDAIAIIDHKGRYLLQNAAHQDLLGYEDQDLIDRTPAIHLGPAAFEEVAKALAETGKHLAQHDSRTNSGMIRRIEISAFAVGGKHGEPPLFVGIKRAVSDVEQRRQEAGDRERDELRGRLRQAQKMEVIGQLAAGVAHDFNNLLTPIMGYADLELGGIPEGSSLAGSLQGILSSARRGRALTSQLLAFASKQVMSMEVVDLAEQIHSTSAMLRQLIPYSSHSELKLELDPAVPCVSADAGQMHQVLMNLVVNARDAMSEGGQIRIGLRTVEFALGDPMLRVLGKEGTYVNLSVSDQGCGIDLATQERVFEPFFTTKGECGGTGLGLSIAHGIISQHGGHIHAVSELGRGTTFQIYLAPVAALDGLGGPVAVEDSSRVEGEGIILVVEDEASVRTVVVRILEEEGFQILAAEDGPSALALLKGCTSKIDLLLTDVMMPGMEGPELCRLIHQSFPELPVLYMSGFARDALTNDGHLDESISMIEKPFTPAELLDKVARVLSGSGVGRS